MNHKNNFARHTLMFFGRLAFDELSVSWSICAVREVKIKVTKKNMNIISRLM